MCELCNAYPCLPECYNYSSTHSLFRCDVCGEYIDEGEDYIENDIGKMAHRDCFYSIDQLLEWLNYRVKIMTL